MLTDVPDMHAGVGTISKFGSSSFGQKSTVFFSVVRFGLLDMSLRHFPLAILLFFLFVVAHCVAALSVSDPIGRDHGFLFLEIQ